MPRAIIRGSKEAKEAVPGLEGGASKIILGEIYWDKVRIVLDTKEDSLQTLAWEAVISDIDELEVIVSFYKLSQCTCSVNTDPKTTIKL